MRVYLTGSLLRVIESLDNTLDIGGRLTLHGSVDIESRLKDFASTIMGQFNFFANEGETIDYVSRPIAYMPDEFTMSLDVERLGRLARELLIAMVPLYVGTWETREISVSELWLGGKDLLLSNDERAQLRKTMREVWAMPIRGKTFVLDRGSFRSHARWVGTLDAIREAKGIIQEHQSGECDYYVTDHDEAVQGSRGSAKHVVDTLTLSVMLGTGDL